MLYSAEAKNSTNSWLRVVLIDINNFRVATQQRWPGVTWEKGEPTMRAMRAEQFSGYEALKLVELPKPTVTDRKVLVRITAAGVTPLDHTILSGKFHIPEVPPSSLAFATAAFAIFCASS
jgi:hypothetical protein